MCDYNIAVDAGLSAHVRARRAEGHARCVDACGLRNLSSIFNTKLPLLLRWTPYLYKNKKDFHDMQLFFMVNSLVQSSLIINRKSSIFS